MNEYGMTDEELAYLGGGFSIEEPPTVIAYSDGSVDIFDAYGDVSSYDHNGRLVA